MSQRIPININRSLVERLNAFLPDYPIEAILLTSVFTLLYRYMEKPDVDRETDDTKYSFLQALKHTHAGHHPFRNIRIHHEKHDDGFSQYFIEDGNNHFTSVPTHRLLAHLHNILNIIQENPAIHLHDIPLLSQNELAAISTLNRTEAKEHNSETISNLLHAATLSSPSFPAVTFHHPDGVKTTLSYEKLEAECNKLAAHIRTNLNGDISKAVGVCLTRSPNLIVAALAVLISGHPLIVLDPRNQHNVTTRFNELDVPMVISDDTFNDFHNLPFDITTLDSSQILPTSTAYYCKTSGSTHEPKLAECTHGAVMNLINSLMHDQNHQLHTKILSTAPATFDAFLYDIFVALATQGTIHLTDNKHRLLPTAIEDLVRKENIDFAAFPAEILSYLSETIPLKYVISMGSAANPGTLARWRNAGKRVENDLGHTETGIHLSTHRFEIGDNPAIIGTPLRKMNMLILDKHGNVCPFDVPGELYVAGPGLAKGYVGNPALTKQKFRHAIFDAVKNQYTFVDEPTSCSTRLYATGDICSYIINQHHQAEVKILGRQDDMLKIHGVRVELNEITNTLKSHPILKSVLLRPNKQRNALIAYVVPSSENASEDDMKDVLDKHLKDAGYPAVARPKAIILLSELPLKSNGKYDFDKLPKPIVPPPLPAATQTKLLSIILPIWLNALEISEFESINLTKSFAELGGDSSSFANLETLLNRSTELHKNLNLPASYRIDLSQLPASITLSKLESTLKQLTQLPSYKQSAALTLLPPPRVIANDSTNSSESPKVTRQGI